MTETTDVAGTQDGPRYCIKCRLEGKDTLLYYSIPRKPTDTWYKSQEKTNDYRCIAHVKKDSHVNRHSKKNTEYGEKKQRIYKYYMRKVSEFRRLWNDPQLLYTIDQKTGKKRSRTDQERLTLAFQIYDIRGQKGEEGGHTHDGYSPKEMTEVIKSDEIEFSASGAVEKWDIENKHTYPREIRDIVKRIMTEFYLQYESEIRVKNRKQLENSIRGIIEGANVLSDPTGEKIVTTPEQLDPDGNKVPRYHLLTSEETKNRRAEKKKRQQLHLQNTIDREEEICQLVQKKLAEEEKIKQQQHEKKKDGLSDNDNSVQ